MDKNATASAPMARASSIAFGAPSSRDPSAPGSLAACIKARVDANPNGEVIAYAGSGDSISRTHAELWRRSTSLASGLRAFGGRAGRSVALLLPDILDCLPAYWASLRSGLVAAPLGPTAMAAHRDGGDEALHAILALLDQPIIVVNRRTEVLIDSIRRWRGDAEIALIDDIEPSVESCDEIAAANPSCLIPTSGSTGRTKLVALSESAILHRAFPKMLEGVWPTILSQFPIDGVSGFQAAFLLHGSWVQMPQSELTTRPLSVLDAAERYRVNALALTNSTIARLLSEAAHGERQWDLGSLTSVLLGAETIVPRVTRDFARLLERHGAAGVALRAGYGSTETGSLVLGADPTAESDDDEHETSAPLGRCEDGVALRIVDEHQRVVLEGEFGEVQAYCPQNLFSGYAGEPSGIGAYLTNDGWWRSGDIGRLQDGVLSLHGRIKDVMISQGRKISLADIDAALLAELGPNVRACACSVVWPGETKETLAVVFAGRDPSARPDPIEASIRRAVMRRFGLHVGSIVETVLEKIPFTGTGKLRRRELSEKLLAGFYGPGASSAAEAGPMSAADKIWIEIFGPEAAERPDESFFDLGGDSLRAVSLFTLIEERVGRTIAVESFFEQPTLAHLRSLVEGSAAPAMNAPTRRTEVPWPLEPGLRQRLLAYFETWSGERPTRDRLVAALNSTGAKPPIFWCFQTDEEFARLAQRLGPDQPLYAFRSGDRLINYDEDEIQAFALRYAHEIIEARPHGPVFVGGNCQGAVVALATAQHLLRRGRAVPLLILMEWGFPLEPYAGPVLLLYGRESSQANPYKRFVSPEIGWKRVFREYASDEITGTHGQFFDDENIDSLASALSRRIDESLNRASSLLARPTPYALDVLGDLPQRVDAGECWTIAVRLQNRGGQIWSAERTGVFLAAYWLDADGMMAACLGERTPTPAMAPNTPVELALSVKAPDFAGSFTLVIDLVEEGSDWIDGARQFALQAQMVVADPSARP